LVEYRAEQAQPQAADDALLGHVEEVEDPEVEDRVTGTTRAEKCDVSQSAAEVAVHQTADRLGDPMRDRERQRQSYEEDDAAGIQPPSMRTRNAEQLQGSVAARSALALFLRIRLGILADRRVDRLCRR
jgi:hypothetical protein